MSGIINNAKIEYTYTVTGTGVSGAIQYNGSLAYEDEMREGFREVFKDEFKEEINNPLQRMGEPDIQLFPRPRTRATPAPQIKAVPPPSQPTKPIINERGRVKRAFDFDD